MLKVRGTRVFYLAGHLASRVTLNLIALVLGVLVYKMGLWGLYTWQDFALKVVF